MIEKVGRFLKVKIQVENIELASLGVKSGIETTDCFIDPNEIAYFFQDSYKETQEDCIHVVLKSGFCTNFLGTTKDLLKHIT